MVAVRKTTLCHLRCQGQLSHGVAQELETEEYTDTLIHNRRDEYYSISSKGVKGKCAQ